MTSENTSVNEHRLYRFYRENPEAYPPLSEKAKKIETLICSGHGFVNQAKVLYDALLPELDPAEAEYLLFLYRMANAKATMRSRGTGTQKERFRRYDRAQFDHRQAFKQLVRILGVSEAHHIWETIDRIFPHEEE